MNSPSPKVLCEVLWVQILSLCNLIHPLNLMTSIQRGVRLRPMNA